MPDLLIHVLFVLNSVHTLKNLISQDESSPDGSAPQKSEFFGSLICIKFILCFSVLVTMTLIHNSFSTLPQHLAISLYCHPFGSNPVKRSKHHSLKCWGESPCFPCIYFSAGNENPSLYKIQVHHVDYISSTAPSFMRDFVTLARY